MKHVTKALSLAMLLATVAAAEPQAPGDAPGLIPLRPGPDTTVVEGPLREDGTVDYVEALHAMVMEGVRPEENAFADLARVMPAKAWPSDAYRKEVFRRLGIEEPPADAPRLVWWEDFARERGLSGVPAEPPENFWQEAAAAVPSEADRMYERALEGPWTAGELPEVAAWLEANRPALAILEAASRKPGYAAPIIAEDGAALMTVVLPHLGVSREVARICVARANAAIGRQDREAAWQDAMMLQRWSRLIAREPLMISRLVAMSLTDMRSEITQSLIEAPVTAGEARAMLDELATAAAFPPLRDAIDFSERLSALELIQQLYRGDATVLESFAFTEEAVVERLRDRAHHPAFDPNAAMRQINEVFDELALTFATTDYEAFLRDYEAWESRLEKGERELAINLHRLVPEVGGPVDVWTDVVTHTFLRIVMPALSSAQATATAVGALEALEPVAIALAGYRDQHGRLPETLDALVPGWLPAVPVDPFTGDPVRYRLTPQGATVYSVGRDLEDDLGELDVGGGDGDTGFFVPATPVVR